MRLEGEKEQLRVICLTFLGSKMAFKKQFTKQDFLSALSQDWQKTREIADKVGCKNLLVTNTLLKMEEIEWRWVPGGKQGTREWRLKELEFK